MCNYVWKEGWEGEERGRAELAYQGLDHGGLLDVETLDSPYVCTGAELVKQVHTVHLDSLTVYKP